MKKMFSAVTVAMLSLSASSYADTMISEKNKIQNEVQNHFKTMSTDELLDKRGKMTTQQEREALHNELMNRQQTMSKEQNEKWMNRPDKTSNSWGSQNQGNAYGQGQGMMQGQHKGAGKGKGGR